MIRKRFALLILASLLLMAAGGTKFKQTSTVLAVYVAGDQVYVVTQHDGDEVEPLHDFLVRCAPEIAEECKLFEPGWEIQFTGAISGQWTRRNLHLLATSWCRVGFCDQPISPLRR